MSEAKTKGEVGACTCDEHGEALELEVDDGLATVTTCPLCREPMKCNAVSAWCTAPGCDIAMKPISRDQLPRQSEAVLDVVREINDWAVKYWGAVKFQHTPFPGWSDRLSSSVEPERETVDFTAPGFPSVCSFCGGAESFIVVGPRVAICVDCAVMASEGASCGTPRVDECGCIDELDFLKKQAEHESVLSGNVLDELHVANARIGELERAVRGDDMGWKKYWATLKEAQLTELNLDTASARIEELEGMLERVSDDNMTARRELVDRRAERDSARAEVERLRAANVRLRDGVELDEHGIPVCYKAPGQDRPENCEYWESNYDGCNDCKYAEPVKPIETPGALEMARKAVDAGEMFNAIARVVKHLESKP